MNAKLLHDGKMVGVVYETGKTIRLVFETAHRTQVDTILHGVERFVATNLWDSNIVLDVLSTKFRNLDTRKIDDIIKSAFPEEFFGASAAPDTSVSNRQLEHWLSQIKAGLLHVFLVEPSYGAEVVAICADVEVTEKTKQST